MKFFSTHNLLVQGQIRTSSQLRKWWLTLVRGYSVEKTFLHVQRGILGRLAYAKTWILNPR